ncbi:transcriptional repressor DicA [Klebsiella pneumoniae 909957]|jgi:transcriptional regulator with XRE-family HTH domain|nr:transcriptional repressor DicA [Klebsiella pneumoniae 909957]QBP08169.1 regulatory protein Cro [Klebsiella phage ST405-OXA48phi1.2]DAY60830.1 MAG TPA: Repressor protein CI [Caudoviricetes sp.]
MMENKTFGSRLLERRKQLKLSQSALAKLVKVSHVTISQWERDETQPAGKRLFALSSGLQCSPTWLLYGDDDQVPGEPIPRQEKELSEEQQELLGLFDALPDSDREGFLNELRARVEMNNQRFEELLKVRKRASRK